MIDHARRRSDTKWAAQKSVDDFLPARGAQLELALAVNGLLTQLADSKPKWRDLVEVKYFLGLTDEEAAVLLGVKLRTMQRMWRDTREWLFDRMESGRAKQSAG